MLCLFKKKIKNKSINGTMLKPYSISWTPNGNIDVMLSLKYFSFGFKKNDRKNVLIKETIELNSIAGYLLGKLFKINKTTDILDNEIRVPRINDKVKLIKIFKFLTRWE